MGTLGYGNREQHWDFVYYLFLNAMLDNCRPSGPPINELLVYTQRISLYSCRQKKKVYLPVDWISTACSLPLCDGALATAVSNGALTTAVSNGALTTAAIPCLSAIGTQSWTSGGGAGAVVTRSAPNTSTVSGATTGSLSTLRTVSIAIQKDSKTND